MSDIYYQVAVDAPLDTLLTYSHPQWMAETVKPGFQILVPLGGRQVSGFVLGTTSELSEEEKTFTIRPFSAMLSNGQVFPPSLIPLYRWVARYYHHPIGEVLKTALPVTPKVKIQRQISLTQKGQQQYADHLISGKAEKSRDSWLMPLFEKGLFQQEDVNTYWRDPSKQRRLKKMAVQGIIRIQSTPVPPTLKEKKQVVIKPGPKLAPYCQEHPIELQVVLDLLGQQTGEDLKKSEHKLLDLFWRLFSAAHGKAVIQAQIRHLYPGCSQPIKSLCEKEILQLGQKQVHRDPFGQVPEFHGRPEQLTEEQQQVLDAIFPAIAAGSYKPFLLHGVTGCGKTEVYLQAVEKTLLQGKQALVLVPEIALASQLEAHFFSRFGEQLAVLHSGLTPGERFDQWHRVIQGKASVVLGARSAVFAPLDSLGVIIVDEEHEPAYKQEDGLRYNGRDLAVLRANFSSCPVVLGSATPSVVSYHHASQKKYTLLTIHKRVTNNPLPKITVIDLKARKRSRPDLFFSDQLINAISQNLDAGQQSLLFVNRRGFSSSMICKDCGTIVGCKHCEVSLTYHRSSQSLICHYCGYTLAANIVCDGCKSTNVGGIGIGSERIEEEVTQLFPQARVSRLDSDTAVNRKQYLGILKAVRNKQIDVLIGTQMIAKGLHFPGITLVGVVWADSGLSLPDYKASERTFSLLSQVTGRAGRGEIEGRVIIQTHQPDHYAVFNAKHHDYQALFEKETELRAQLHYPPFSRLVNVKFSGTLENKVEDAAQKTAAFLHDCNVGKKVEILGPAPSPLQKLRNRTRWQLMMKSTCTESLHRLCSLLSDTKKRICHHSVRIHIDVDPESMM